MIALISDIHANLPALQAVFADLDALGTVDRVYCLGDVVGYGPHPVECLELVAQRCSRILMGNHEHALLHGPYLFTANARRAIEWTKEVILNRVPAHRRRLLWELIENLPSRYEFDEVLLVHGSPRDPVMDYVLESDLWEGSDPRKIDDIFAGFARYCFVGHSHKPGVFTEDHCFLAGNDLPDGFALGDGRYLINVGSVGQPRDHDPRACYCLYSGDAIYFRRVEYDIEATARAIQAIPELGERSAQRLFKGE